MEILIVNIYNINMFISEAEGFGINTDIFETNVLNLAVVIGVLIYYGRVAFSICCCFGLFII
jgi:hypothetical protein